jgi:hypothetical protein
MEPARPVFVHDVAEDAAVNTLVKSTPLLDRSIA